MTLFRLILAGALFILGGCSVYPPLTDETEITGILVEKQERRLFLVSDSQPVAVFPIHLGHSPTGKKEREGDGKTPEGTYVIDRKNPNSSFHLSLGISYPNHKDIENAALLGAPPGGDIFIHGMPNGYRAVAEDWTEGCIAVSNEHIETIYQFVKNGTPITIVP